MAKVTKNSQKKLLLKWQNKNNFFSRFFYPLQCRPINTLYQGGFDPLFSAPWMGCFDPLFQNGNRSATTLIIIAFCLTSDKHKLPQSKCLISVEKHNFLLLKVMDNYLPSLRTGEYQLSSRNFLIYEGRKFLLFKWCINSA